MDGEGWVGGGVHGYVGEWTGGRQVRAWLDKWMGECEKLLVQVQRKCLLLPQKRQS